MKKKVIGPILCLALIIGVVFGTLCIIDHQRMKNNAPVVFSTWGRKYSPPLTELDEPPVLQLVDENNNVVVTCLVSTNEWHADGVSRIADYAHPQQREYGEENTITLGGEKTLYLNNKDAKITDVTLYSVETADAPYKAEHTGNSIKLNGTGKNVYFADISTEFEQGTVAYCFKIICGQNIECE